MTRTTHRIYISSLVFIVIASVIALTYIGFGYYRESIEERFFHPQNEVLKPSGYLGHGFGIVGSAMVVLGVGMYMARKRIKRLAGLGYLKHWLEFHIFLCVLGPVFVVFHTTFKFGGLVAISFWSMVAVVLSGVIGRFIYIQIPRSVEGRELSLNEINVMKNETLIPGLAPDAFSNRPDFSDKGFFSRIIAGYRYDRGVFKVLKKDLKQLNLSRADYKKARQVLKNEITLNRRIDMLVSMKNLMEYWHVLHLPFALAMLIVMVIHVVVVITLGYKWIF